MTEPEIVEQRDAEEVLARLQMEGRGFLDWLQWKVDCFECEHGRQATQVMLVPVLYREYLDTFVGNIRWQVVTERYPVTPFALTFAGVPVVKGNQCLVS